MALAISQIEAIAQQVYRQFPDVKGALPTVAKHPLEVQNQPAAKASKPPGGAARTSGAQAPLFLLTFKGRGQGPGGRSIVRIVRVIADERGKVLKISTSK